MMMVLDTLSFTHALELLGLFSIGTFICSLIAIPWLIGRMRSDYFISHWHQVEKRQRQHPALALINGLARNGVGCILILAGIAMLVLPGQGLLTILVGFCLMDFPGKRIVLDRLSQISHIQKGLNWIRFKQGKAAFVFPEKQA
jgi:hypothetical protein